MNTVGAFPAGGGDDFRRKISGPNPTIEATVESRRRELANADVGLGYVTGHSGRFVVDPPSTQSAIRCSGLVALKRTLGPGPGRPRAKPKRAKVATPRESELLHALGCDALCAR